MNSSIKSLWFMFITFLVLSFQINLATAEVFSCAKVLENENDLRSELDLYFTRAFSNPHVYKSSKCACNSIMLYRFFKANLGDVIKSSDFKVHYIARAEWFHMFNDRFPLRFTKARTAVYKEEITWRHHVVLEYKGRIYDLDYSHSPTPMSADMYFADKWVNEAYIPGRDGKRRSTSNKVHIMTVGGDNILNIENPEDVLSRVFVRDLYSKFSSKALADFIEERDF